MNKTTKFVQITLIQQSLVGDIKQCVYVQPSMFIFKTRLSTKTFTRRLSGARSSYNSYRPTLHTILYYTTNWHQSNERRYLTSNQLLNKTRMGERAPLLAKAVGGRVLGPRPGLAIVSFWQGILEIILRALALVSHWTLYTVATGYLTRWTNCRQTLSFAPLLHAVYSKCFR